MFGFEARDEREGLNALPFFCPNQRQPGIKMQTG
ncbi:hypothetical protein PAECIP111890_02805 [Paenibacillus sp. JJ-223]|nr:hypothetical protein PAECIP111890_02805 [Paenibacillus sp. JJ-223]